MKDERFLTERSAGYEALFYPQKKKEEIEIVFYPTLTYLGTYGGMKVGYSKEGDIPNKDGGCTRLL